MKLLEKFLIVSWTPCVKMGQKRKQGCENKLTSWIKDYLHHYIDSSKVICYHGRIYRKKDDIWLPAAECNFEKIFHGSKMEAI